MDCREDEPFLKLLGLTGHMVRIHADQLLKQYDLTVQQLHVIKQTKAQNGLPQNQLSLLTLKSPANITRILDRLEKKGRIERRRNPEDRRSSLVFLTPKGERLLNEVIELFDGFQQQLLGEIEPEKLQVVEEVLRHLRNTIEKMSEK